MNAISQTRCQPTLSGFCPLALILGRDAIASLPIHLVAMNSRSSTTPSSRPTFVSQNQLQPDALSSSGKMPPTFTAPRSVRAPLHSTSSQSTPRESHFRKVLRNSSGPFSGRRHAWIPTALPSMSAMGKSSIPHLPLQSTPMASPSRFLRHLKVDAPASRVYFSGPARGQFFPNYNYLIQAFSLANQQPIGSISMLEKLQSVKNVSLGRKPGWPGHQFANLTGC